MARVFTYFGLATVTAMGLMAACGGGSDDNGDGDGSITGDGDGPGGIDPGETGGGLNPGADPSRPGGIFEYDNPEGFLNHDDGSGNPSFKDAALTPESVTELLAAADSNPTGTEDQIFNYPLNDTMLPWNLTFIEFQWKQPEGYSNSVLIRAKSATTTYHMYLLAECTNSGYCSVELPKTEFQTIGLKNLSASVEFDVVSTGAAGPTKSAPVTLHYSPEKLIGTLYFWASAERTIKRVIWGSQKASDFIIPRGRMGDEGEEPNADYECVSCHSVSRDGTTIAFGVSPEEGENIGGIQVAPTSDPYSPYIVPTEGTTPYTTGPSGVYDGASHGNPEQLGPTDSLGHNVALNHDGTMMAVNATGDLNKTPTINWPSALQIKSTMVKDQVFGSYEAEDPVWGPGRMGIQPEWSPTSEYLVVALAKKDDGVENLSAWASTNSQIAVVPVSGSGQLSAAQVIATPAEGYTLFYPTWSPDSRYIAFVGAKQEAADRATADGSLNNERGVIYMVSSSGGPYTCPDGPGCIELARGTGYSKAEADVGSVEGSTWPKFAPFPQGDNVYFITLTAKRPVGAIPGKRKQLWMFGIDVSQPTDPSYAPFWIPYQNTDDVANLAPYWTETPPCDTTGGTCNGCLGSEICAVNRDTNECRCDAPIVTR